MPRVQRVDRCIAKVDFDAATPSPGVAAARVLPGTGYTVVTAYLARDGLLQYGDGESVWDEYRSRAELVAAAGSFSTAPLTDGHPTDFVTSVNWTDHARGYPITTPRVTGADADGVSYLVADVLIADSELLQKMRTGRDQLSIAFHAFVEPVVNGRADDGTMCAFLQRDLVGNHIANVDQGRAGPSCRAFLDTAEKRAHNGGAVSDPIKTDNMGQGVEHAKFTLPDGSTVEIPTVIAGLLASQAQQIAALTAPAPAPAGETAGLEPAPAAGPAEPAEPAEPAAAPEAEAPEAEAPEAAAPAAAPAAAAFAPDEPDDEEEDSEDPMKKAKGDSVALDLTAARAFVGAQLPWLAEKVASMDAAEIGVLMKAALEKPSDKFTVAAPTNPFAVPVQTGDAADVDPIELAQANFLASAGY